MTSNHPVSPNYSQLDGTESENKHETKRHIFFLVLTLILGTETLITAFLFYNFSVDIERTGETSRDGSYPLHCLSAELDRPTDHACCDLFNQYLKQSAQQRMLLDIQNSLLETLEEHNITDVFRPAVHVGAKQALHQFHGLQNEGINALDRVQWDNKRGQVNQGLVRLSPDGEITVPRGGTYFVFSQVHFETHLGHGVHFTQYLYKRTGSFSGPVLLAKAAVTPCSSGRSGAQLYSSHQGALYRLEKGDRLSLYVLNISDVHFPHEATYFGAFMIN